MGSKNLVPESPLMRHLELMPKSSNQGSPFAIGAYGGTKAGNQKATPRLCGGEAAFVLPDWLLKHGNRFSLCAQRIQAQFEIRPRTSLELR